MISFLLTIPWRYFVFWFSVPNRRNFSVPEVTGQSSWARPQSTFRNSSRIRACSRNPKPAPPYCSLMKASKNCRPSTFFKRGGGFEVPIDLSKRRESDDRMRFNVPHNNVAWQGKGWWFWIFHFPEVRS